MKLPPIRDARWMQVSVLLAYALVARELFHFERTHLVVLACVVWAVVLDELFGAYWFGRRIFPLSAVIIGLASSLLLDARSAVPYLCAVTLAVASKALVRADGRHLYNPACFGVVVMLQLAPRWVTGMPSLFGGYLAPSLVFATLGLATTIYARQAAVSLSYVGGFLAFGVVRALALRSSVLVTLAPALGPAFLLFSFHMISDPATTPRAPRLRVAFGLVVALLDAAFRVLHIPNGAFYALFIVCSFNPWLRVGEARRARA
jgi:Na+-translocating ferredoxin:NAD+ oxidoreductase RnfD subunit